MSAFRLGSTALLTILLGGCLGTEIRGSIAEDGGLPPGDGTVAVDAEIWPDGARADAGPSADSQPADAASPDSATPSDAAAGDLGAPPDSSMAIDAGTVDTGTIRDAEPRDSGPEDLGPPDTGVIFDGGPPPSCAPLADRVSITAVDVSPSTVVVSGGGFFSPDRPVILSTLVSGGSAVSWSDNSGQIHITPLDANDQRGGADLTLTGTEVRGFVAHDDGGAVLLRRDDVMALVRVDATGGVLFDVEIVGNNDHQQVGDKWIDTWSHDGRLAWSGSRYAAYFGHTQSWASGNHQGDILRHFDSSGAQVSGGWGWGCSHSLDVRLFHNGNRFGPVCLSDCYPDKGIYFNHTTEITAEPSGNCSGGSTARLGGLVPVSDGFYFSWTSPEGRSSTDVGLVHIDNSGSVSPPVWITDTPNIDEAASHLAAYGQDLLVAWREGGDQMIAIVDVQGNLVEGPTPISAESSDRDDFVNFANGDVGWAHAWSGMGELKITRVAYCE